MFRYSTDLLAAWKKDEKTKSFNIANKLASLLSDTSNHSYYPVMFVMVINELEKYGDLIVERIRSAVYTPSSSSSSSSSSSYFSFSGQLGIVRKILHIVLSHHNKLASVQ